MRNLKHRLDANPIQADMNYPHSNLSRSYLRHLFTAGEMLGPILLSMHNLAYYHRLMAEARAAIAADQFVDFYHRRMSGWGLANKPDVST